MLILSLFCARCLACQFNRKPLYVNLGRQDCALGNRNWSVSQRSDDTREIDKGIVSVGRNQSLPGYGKQGLDDSALIQKRNIFWNKLLTPTKGIFTKLTHKIQNIQESCLVYSVCIDI